MTKDNRASARSQDKVAQKIKDKVLEKIPLHSLNVSVVDPKILKPNKYNPNKQEAKEFELLQASIRSDGFTMPILANKDQTIIDGEHRWRAALAIGLKQVPVVYLDLDDARAKMATIRHNKATGSHDANLEAMVIADIEKLLGADFIQRELMIDKKSLDAILNFTNAPDMLAGEEFGLSWSPVKSKELFDADEAGNPVDRSTFRARKTVDSAIVLRSPTSEANRLAYAKVIKKDAEAGRQNLYVLSAVLNPEEGLRVQRVLEDPTRKGQTPAERFYWLAQEKEKAHAN